MMTPPPNTTTTSARARRPLAYRREDSPGARGRHLVAARSIERHELIFVERSLLDLQSAGNAHSGALVCRCCRSFLGGPELCLDLASGRVTREDAYRHWSDARRRKEEKEDEKKGGGNKDDAAAKRKLFGRCEHRYRDDAHSYEMVRCRNRCGELFCSDQCELDMWECYGHSLLCTGRISDSSAQFTFDNHESGGGNGDGDEESEGKVTSNTAEEAEGGGGGDGVEVGKPSTKPPTTPSSQPPITSPSSHPLIQFKVHAVQTNEILLMVADLIATVACLLRQRLIRQSEAASTSTSGGDGDEGGTENAAAAASTASPSFCCADELLDDILAPYRDFTMVPWWDVATAPLLSSPTGLTEAATLDEALRCLCDDSARLLRDALFHPHTLEQCDVFMRRALEGCRGYGDGMLFTGDFFGMVVGSFEQNAIGIRARHPLCRDVMGLGSRGLREESHDALVGCIEMAGMIGNDEDEGGDGAEGREGRNAYDDDDIDDEGRERGGGAKEGAFGGVTGADEGVRHDAEDSSGGGPLIAAAAAASDTDDRRRGVIEVGSDDDGSQSSSTSSSPLLEEESRLAGGGEEGGEGGYDYDVDDIAMFLSGLEIHREGDDGVGNGGRGGGEGAEGADEGDDLDRLFPPLDGTAMFVTACKMNHSCDPNVMVRYRAGWGGRCGGGGGALVLQAVALRDVAAGEELCISYVDGRGTLEERRRATEDYGFRCECRRCLSEERHAKQRPDDDGDGGGCGGGGGGGGADAPASATEAVEWGDLLDPFGDDDSASDGDGYRENSDSTSGVEGERTEGGCEGAANAIIVEDGDDTVLGEGEMALRGRAREIFRSSLGHTPGGVPRNVFAPAAAFVVRRGSLAVDGLRTADTDDDDDDDASALGRELARCVERCIESLKEQDLYASRTAGGEGMALGMSMLFENGSWPNISWREAYGCCAVAAALGCSNDGMLSCALVALDKAIVLGLPREDVRQLLDYAESFAPAYRGLHCGTRCVVRDYRDEHCITKLHEVGLSKKMCSSVDQMGRHEIDEETFLEEYVSKQRPLLIRNFASSWPAVEKWRDLGSLLLRHGGRIVPIEVESMRDGTMREKFLSIGEFIESYMVESSNRLAWGLSDTNAMDRNLSQRAKVAYMAQHQLFEQVPDLLADVEESPKFCGPSGPAHRNVWIGTGGTRTPLHYDSFDNLFVQIVGAKYVRLYSASETDKLYIIKSDQSYAMQRNMSELNCEAEDFEGKHPLAVKATFLEALLLPGDCLFIPAREWHYVRGLSSSFSVNYWW